jgi:hypothetical protein
MQVEGTPVTPGGGKPSQPSQPHYPSSYAVRLFSLVRLSRTTHPSRPSLTSNNEAGTAEASYPLANGEPPVVIQPHSGAAGACVKAPARWVTQRPARVAVPSGGPWRRVFR